MVRLSAELVLAAALTACRGSEPVRPDGTPTPEAPPQAPAVSSEMPDEPHTTSAPDLSTVEITLERTECYGWCPNYTVTISGDGTVRYEGRTFVKEVGVREGQVSPETVRDLVRTFEDLGFHALRDRYEHQITDLATETLTVRLGDRTKRVENYGSRGRFDPFDRELPNWETHEILFLLGDEVDRAVGIERWIGTYSEREVLLDKFREGFPGRTRPR